MALVPFYLSGRLSDKIGEAVGKIPTMVDEQYQQLLYYQHYGESRMAAPDDPVGNKTPREPSGGGASPTRPPSSTKRTYQT